MSMHINTARTVAVDRGVQWQPMSTCPTGVKVQLLGDGDVATYGSWDGKNTFWKGWAPLPSKPQWMLEGRREP
jgi:hypothetical protein